MSNMILHSGGKAVSYKDLGSVPIPTATDSYKPVPYQDVIDHVESRVHKLLDREVSRKQFGLSRKGMQMFGVLTVDMGDSESDLAIGCRQSYDKSIALGLASGAGVTVCDNLCFDGDSFKVVRKNTKNVWEEFQTLCDEAISKAPGFFESIQSDFRVMKAINVEETRGAEIIGVAQYENVLRPQQANIAFRDWKTPRHREFSARNMWSLYQCFTEALKHGPAGSTMERHKSTHIFFKDQVSGLPDEVLTEVFAAINH